MCQKLLDYLAHRKAWASWISIFKDLNTEFDDVILLEGKRRNESLKILMSEQRKYLRFPRVYSSMLL